MDCEGQPIFSSKDEEVGYWKELADRYMLEKQDLQRELDDYTDDSRQLEKELETSLEQSEKTNRELRTERHKMQCEIESLKARLEQSSREIASMQNEVLSLRGDVQRQGIYIRELEQKNDDLERAQRVVAESVAAAESTLNTAIERNAILESEVDEKEQLKIKLQRLMDETRDLKQELFVKERGGHPDNERTLTNGFTTQTVVDSNRIEIDTKNNDKQLAISPVKRDPTLVVPAMTPSSRHSALNLVSDILRKIGALESKISECRNASRESAHNYMGTRDNIRNRRIARSSQNPSVQQPVLQ